MSEKPNMVSFVHAQCYCKWVSRVDTGTMCTEYAIHIAFSFLHRLVRAVNIFERKKQIKSREPKRVRLSWVMNDNDRLSVQLVYRCIWRRKMCVNGSTSKEIRWCENCPNHSHTEIAYQTFAGRSVDPNENYWISAPIAWSNFSTA